MTQLQLTELPQAPETSRECEPEPAREPAAFSAAINLTVDNPNVDLSEPVVDVTDGSANFLSPRDRRILALERQWFSNAGSKEAAITRQFGMTPTRYFQVLNGLLDDPRAMRQDPQVVARLRRLRTARQRSRRRYRRVLRH